MSSKKRSAVLGSGSYSKLIMTASNDQSDGSSHSSSAQAGHVPAVAPVSLGNNHRDRFVALDSEAPSSPERMRNVDNGQSATVVYSPGGNRDRFQSAR